MTLTYFIADAHGFVKIGKTTRQGLRKRFGHLQIAHAEPLALLATVQLSEVSVHCLFRELRVRGEWFRLEPSLLDWLAIHGDFKPLSSYPAAKDRIRERSRAEIIALVNRLSRDVK